LISTSRHVNAVLPMRINQPKRENEILQGDGEGSGGKTQNGGRFLGVPKMTSRMSITPTS